MGEINYARGDATVPSVRGVKVIAHVCNDIGGWGKGFVLALSRRWPEPEKAYRAWHRDRAANDFGLGAVQLVQVERQVWVANMIGQRGIRAGSKGVPVMPRIGCGLAGGKWSRVEPLIVERLVGRGIAVSVYDHGD
ncbi:Appr-1-p processing protein [Streptomyces sp. NPDC058420]|uniref:Appr-1-p processing protein n=1 Tax=Streptomyces sp. NPDC058420 TaxID=3346489 RepID=UPI0036564381